MCEYELVNINSLIRSCTGTLRGNHSNPETQCSLKSLISPNHPPIKDSLEFKVITTFSVDGRAKRRNIYEFLYLPGLVCCNLVKQKLKLLILFYLFFTGWTDNDGSLFSL